jgi:outer membrane protein assembly factor BamB
MLTQNKLKTRTTVYLLILLIVGLAGLVISAPWEGSVWFPSLTTHKPSVNESWVLSEIYIGKSAQPLILAVDDKLIFLGSDDFHKTSNIIALQANTGQVIWRANYDGYVIAVNSPAVIVGQTGQVVALDISDGKVLWKQNILANVTRVAIKDNLIYAVGAGANHYYILDALTGKVLQKINGECPVWDEVVLGNVTYKEDGNGNVLAINKNNDVELWRTYTGAISNLAATQSYVYAINPNGNVVRLNSMSGDSLNTLIKFESSPPLLHNAEDNSLTYSYYVAVNHQSNKLFVYLGDSAQLFAFQLPISP